MNTTFLQVPEKLDKWKNRAENLMEQMFPTMLDGGHFHSISVGRNKDSTVGSRGGFKLRPTQAMLANAIYLDVPSRMIGDTVLADPDTKRRTILTRATDAVQALAADLVEEHMNKGMDRAEAQKRVTDSLRTIGYYDNKTGLFVAERLSPGTRTKDSFLSGLNTPFWDIARIQKVFKQPFLRGYSDRLVNKVGIPNIWADYVQIYTESFEGAARISNVARGFGDHNTSIAAKNRTGTMFADVMNLVIDYESQNPAEAIVGGMDGNWLTNALVGDRDVYANLMLEILGQTLWYFGDTETGFEGLLQIANRDNTVTAYPSTQPPAKYMWDNDGAGSGTGVVNNTVGADLLLMLYHLLADRLEELQFLPVTIRINCAPVLYKALKFSMLSKVYNQNNPLSIISTAFASDDKIGGTVITKAFDGVARALELIPDPMLSAGSAMNTVSATEDLMFITFPQLQSEMDSGLVDLVMAPTPIDKMILPSAPGFRDGTVRTAVKRIGSLLVPVAGVVHVITGMGQNTRYTPPT